MVQASSILAWVLAPVQAKEILLLQRKKARQASNHQPSRNSNLAGLALVNVVTGLGAKASPNNSRMTTTIRKSDSPLAVLVGA